MRTPVVQAQWQLPMVRAGPEGKDSREGVGTRQRARLAPVAIIGPCLAVGNAHRGRQVAVINTARQPVAFGSVDSFPVTAGLGIGSHETRLSGSGEADQDGCFLGISGGAIDADGPGENLVAAGRRVLPEEFVWRRKHFAQ